MNDNSSLERKERVIALLGLAATEPPAGTSCPVEETLAQFIEGQLTGRARQAMLAHLNRCPSCYYHWLEVGLLARLNQRVPGEEEAPRAVSALQRLHPLLERKPDAPSRAELRRALEITMQQLAP
jgi:hypothetical protein